MLKTYAFMHEYWRGCFGQYFWKLKQLLDKNLQKASVHACKMRMNHSFVNEKYVGKMFGTANFDDGNIAIHFILCANENSMTNVENK